MCQNLQAEYKDRAQATDRHAVASPFILNQEMPGQWQ